VINIYSYDVYDLSLQVVSYLQLTMLVVVLSLI
jgi:hypothetical protein